MGTSLNRSLAVLNLLVAAVLGLSACGSDNNAPAYAGSAKVDCGGKQTLVASGSTAQANAMTRFVKAYEKACPGQTLTYTSNGSGAGVSEFLGGKTDFGGSAISRRAATSMAKPRSVAARRPGTCQRCSARWPSPTTSMPSTR